VTRSIAEWSWRVAVLCALGLIAWELQRVHDDLAPLPDEQATTAAAPDPVLDSVADVRDDIERLTQKVDAILVVMARSN
jgi:hypothetical protein